MRNFPALITIGSCKYGCRNKHHRQIVKTTSELRVQYKNHTWSGVNNILDPDTTVSWLPIN